MKRKVVLLLLVLALLLSCNNDISNEPLESQAGEAFSRGGYCYAVAYLYQGSNYTGSYEVLRLDATNRVLKYQNRASSVRINYSGPGKRPALVLYDGANENGLYTHYIYDSVANFNKIGFNDLASSFAYMATDVEVSTSTDPYIVLYEEKNYQGPGYTIFYTENVMNLPSVLNDKISSIKVHGDIILSVYEHSNLGGEFVQVIKGGIADLSKHRFDNRASSITCARPTRPYIFAFDGSNYNGEYRTFTKDERHLGLFGFDNRISSLQVFNASPSITLYDKTTFFSSRKRTLGGNVILGSYGMDNKTSRIRF